MEDVTIGNATENGAEQTPAKEHTPQGSQEKSVPYERFAQVNTAKKAAEDALATIVDGMVAELPETFRDIVPALPPAQKAEWIRAAKAKGLFTTQAPANSPDATRPRGKPTEDLSGLSPLAKLQRAYGK